MVQSMVCPVVQVTLSSAQRNAEAAGVSLQNGGSGFPAETAMACRGTAKILVLPYGAAGLQLE